MTLDPSFLKYNALDSACTFECYQGFWPELSQGFQPAYDMTVALFPVLTWMQHRGIRVDQVRLKEARTEILASTKEKQLELNKLCGRELNVNSSKDCQQYFYIEKGISPYYNDGSITTDDNALQRIARGTARRAGLREAKLVQEVRGLQKLESTYLSMEFDSDGRFRSSYNPRGTKFGRLSSSKTIFGTGGNAQNLDQIFKRFLVPDVGRVFWEIDKRQAEWIVVAYLTGDANMLRVVESGKDTHIHTAALMLSETTDLPYEDCWLLIELEHKLVGSNTDPDIIRGIRSGDELLQNFLSDLPRTMSSRQRGKKSNHGLNYDEGYRKYALINELEEFEGKRDVELYHRIYPGIRVWYENVKRQLQRDRSLTNCFGRKVRFMDAWGPDLWKAAYSMLPQSTIVDSLNKGLVAIYDDVSLCSAQGLNIDILTQVHDSILMQVPFHVLLNPRFQEVMDKVYLYSSPEMCYNGRSFRIATDSKVGLNWAGVHPERNPLGMRDIRSAADLPKILESFREHMEFGGVL